MSATAAHGSASSPHAAAVGGRRSGGTISSVSDPHLKDVYAAWLKDLYEDNSAKVVKTLRHRKTNNSSSTNGGNAKTSKKKKEQLLQATEASASKHISQRKVLCGDGGLTEPFSYYD